MTKKNDWIALIEASYSLDGSDQDWLDNLYDHAEPLLEQGMGRGAWTFRCTPTTFQVERYPTRTSKLLRALHRVAHAAAPERWFDLTYRSGDVVGTGSEKISFRTAVRRNEQRGYKGMPPSADAADAPAGDATGRRTA